MLLRRPLTLLTVGKGRLDQASGSSRNVTCLLEALSVAAASTNLSIAFVMLGRCVSQCVRIDFGCARTGYSHGMRPTGFCKVARWRYTSDKGGSADLVRCRDLIRKQFERLLQGRCVDGAIIP